MFYYESTGTDQNMPQHRKFYLACPRMNASTERSVLVMLRLRMGCWYAVRLRAQETRLPLLKRILIQICENVVIDSEACYYLLEEELDDGRI